MNTDLVPDLVLDNEGICNFCRMTEEIEKEYPTGQEGFNKLWKLVKKIKRKQRKQKYDVIIGFSGGCDSTFMIHLAVKVFKLRVLAYHFDNGWNTPIAEENMRKIVKALKVDWIRKGANEWVLNKMNKAFLLASVPDCDIPNDIAAHTLIYELAEKYGIKYIFDGHDYKHEGTCPLSWTYMDARYIKSVYEAYNHEELTPTNYPNLEMKKWLRWITRVGIKRIRPLYYIGWTKEKMKDFLIEEYNWKWYGGHHLENIYTAFCAQYMFPKKFKTDRRYTEYSALIRSNEMSKEQALKLIDKEEKFEHLDLVRNKLCLSKAELNAIMSNPPRSHKIFDTYEGTFRKYKVFFWLLEKMKLVPKTFYVKYCR
jgi:N-acetyl sugar amidotransferase